MTFQSRTLEILGAPTNFIDEGSGPPLVFVHGFPLDHSMWRHQIKHFQKPFRVISPDLPGFGKSSNLDSEFTLASCADVIAELVDKLEIAEPITFCGLSMGGYIGWQFWNRHRDKLKCLVACNTRAAADSETVARARSVSAQSVMKTGSVAVADAMIPKLFFSETREDPKSSTHDVISQTVPSSIAAGQIAMSKRPDATMWLKQIEVPALFVAGVHDTITPPDEMKANAEMVNASSYVCIPSAGHMSPLEQPEEFNRHLESFLNSY